MKQRFALFRRGKVFYCEDTATGKQSSLRTKDEGEARSLLNAKNEAHRQPTLNLQIAKAYLSATDPDMSKRAWRAVMDEMAKTKTGPTLRRHTQAMKEKAFDSIRDLPIVETLPAHLMRVLEAGSVSTNIFLRRIQNFAVDMGWLPWPVLPKKRWPPIRFKEKRAVTREEHQAIVSGEKNPERRAYYECCWHLGASQSDVANLTAEDIDWDTRVVAFRRQKTGIVSINTGGAKARFDRSSTARHRVCDLAELQFDSLGFGHAPGTGE